MVKRDLSHGDQAKTDRCFRGKTRWMLDLRKSIKTTSNFSDKQPRYGEVRDVAIHALCDITSHSVSSESRVNKCHELPLPALFLVDVSDSWSHSLYEAFRQRYLYIVSSSLMVHREHPMWLCEGHLEVLEEYSDFSKIASGNHYKNYKTKKTLLSKVWVPSTSTFLGSKSFLRFVALLTFL